MCNFVEIGFSYYECNTLNLIKKVGKLIDINKDECLSLRRLISYFYPDTKVNIINKKVFRENIMNFSLERKNKSIFFH